MPVRRTVHVTGMILVLSACGEEARVSLSAPLAAPLGLEMLSVTVLDGDRLLRWTGSDFKPRNDNPAPSTPEVDTKTSGPDIQVTFRLENLGTVLSTGTVVLPRRSDWRWHVTISASTENPGEFCFGCFGSTAFPLPEAFRAPGRDSIWVVWSGNSISEPAVY